MITPESVKELLISSNFADRMSAVNQIRQLDHAIAFPLLKTASADPNPRVRYAAVSQFADVGKFNLAESLELLRDRLLRDPEIDVQAVAADALGALKLREAFPELQEVYQKTEEWLLQISIIAALGELGEPQAVTILTAALKSENELIQTMAIGALGELGDRTVVPLLVPFATSSDWQIRYRLAQSLKRLGGEESVAALALLARDEVDQVAAEAKIS